MDIFIGHWFIGHWLLAKFPIHFYLQRLKRRKSAICLSVRLSACPPAACLPACLPAMINAKKKRKENQENEGSRNETVDRQVSLIRYICVN